jgi:hypothetical protein
VVSEERQALVVQLVVQVAWVQLGSLACQVPTVTQPRSQVKHASSVAVAVVAVGPAMEQDSMDSGVRAAVEPEHTAAMLLEPMVCQIPVAVEVPVRLAVPMVELVVPEL